MSEETKRIKDEELKKEQIDEVAGGILPPPSRIPTCSQCGSPMTQGNGVMYYCPNGCPVIPPPIAGSTKIVPCPKCGATIELSALRMPGSVNCTACGAGFIA